MSEIRSVSVRLSAKTSEYIAGMGAAARSTDSLGASLSRVEAKGAAASRGLAGLKKASLYGAGAVVAGLGLAEKAAADFGEKMALVQTLSHANEQQMKQLSSAAMNAGQQIGYTANQVADGEAEMIKAGVSLRDILKGGLKGALDLAAAGQTDVATATTIAASAMTQFKLQGKDIPHLADLLAAGADKALGSVEDLGYGLSQAGTTAHQMGIGVNETVGTLAAFAQAGLIGERGGTTFKQMLLQLASPAKNSAQIMKDYGLSLYNANGQIKTMPQLADNLRKSFDRLTPAQRNAALGTIFGSRAIQGANILMAEGGKGIAEWIRKVNDQGFAAQQASGKLNSLKGDLSKFKAEVQDDLINLGTGSQSPLRNLVQGATRELHKLRTNGDLKRWGNEISDTFTTIGRDALPVAKEVGHALGIIGHDLGAVAKGFQKLPSGIQQAVVTGGVVAYGAHKLGVDSLLKGALGAGGRGGAAGALTGRAGVVPVYVTNWGGKGGPGGGSGGPRGIPVPGGSTPKTPTHLGIPDHFWDVTKTGVRDLLSGSLGKVSGEGLLKGAVRGLLGAPAWISAGDAGNEVLTPKAVPFTPGKWAAEDAKKNAAAIQDQQKSLNRYMADLTGLGKAYASLPKKVQTQIATPGAVTSLADAKRLGRQYDLTPKQLRTVVELTGVRGALTAAQRLQRQLDAIHDKTINITVAINGATHAVSVQAQHGIGGAGADGATVTGAPPYPYADKLLYAVAPGEEIVSNRHGGADLNRAALKAASRGARLKVDGHAADGATAGWPTAWPSTSWKVPQTSPISFAGLQHSLGDLSKSLRETGLTLKQQAKEARASGNYFSGSGGWVEGQPGSFQSYLAATGQHLHHKAAQAHSPITFAGLHAANVFNRATPRGGNWPGMWPGWTGHPGAVRSVRAEIDYVKLAAAMGKARPLYGDVHLAPHNYDQFRREMDADRRRASSDGVRR